MVKIPQFYNPVPVNVEHLPSSIQDYIMSGLSTHLRYPSIFRRNSMMVIYGYTSVVSILLSKTDCFSIVNGPSQNHSNH